MTRTPDPRTDREQLRTISYGTGDLLADRQQLYRFAEPAAEPITEWLFALAGGIAALDEPIVDLGAGNGQYLLALGDRVSVGADLSPGMLAGLRAGGYRGPLVETDAQALPLATASAGTVMANHMLYHVPDIAAACREARRVLRPGGRLLVVTNGRDHLSEIGAALAAGAQRLGYRRLRLDPAGERFQLEEGGAVLQEVFGSVVRHDRRTSLVVPDVAPVMRYLSSLAGLALQLPASIAFDDVVAAARPVVEDAVRRHGSFRIGTHVGAFVCA